MLQRIQMMNPVQRWVIFLSFLTGGIMLLVAATAFLVLITFNAAPRQMATAVSERIVVDEFVTLPDDDAYPASVAASPEGTVYTASYATGAIWAIDSNGIVTEFPNTREMIGSVTGLTSRNDGTLYVLDRIDSNPRAAGGMIWQIDTEGTITQLGTIDDATGFISPDDITIDEDGNIYVSDRGRREVWRIDKAGVGLPWWHIPSDDPQADDVIPTGLVYDTSTETILITDSEAGMIYRVSLDGETTEIIYEHADKRNLPGFDGITVTPDGQIVVAALGWSKVVQIADNDMIVLAENFRGASDVEFANERLFVTNFDQRSLVLPGIEPQLPFALDVITFVDNSE